MGKQRKQIAYVIYPGINLLDVVGIFSALKRLKTAGYESFTVAENLQPLDSGTDLGVVPDKTIHDAPQPDWLVVPGGGIATLKALGNETLRDYVLLAAGSAEQVVGVSTGTLLLAGLGLLDGRKAATHWTYAGLLPALGAIGVQERWVQDGKFITCAGGTASYELGLRLLGKHGSEKLARRHQLRYEYDPQPPLGGMDWSTIDQTELSTILADHQSELKVALQSHPELYRVLYSSEAAALRESSVRKEEG